MIHRIASPDDPRLAPYRHVGDPEWLRAGRLFVAEGRLVVDRLVALGGYGIVSILVNQAAHDAMAERLSAADADVYVCGDPTLVTVTGFRFHRGCLALVTRPDPVSPDRLLDATRLLALEGVGNPDNIGGLFRTAAAFGAGGILLNGTSGDPYYRKAIRTSMGAALRLPFARMRDWDAGLDRFRAHGFRVVALTPAPDAVPIADFAKDSSTSERIVVVVGSEGAGLDIATLATADARVRIPIDPAIDSLNVVVAAAIALERLAPPGDRSVPPASADAGVPS